MINIKLVILGHADRVVNFDLIKKYKSKFFKFSDIERINNLQYPQKDDGYLDIVYTKREIKSIMSNIEFDGICLAIMNYGFNDNFYMHRVGARKVCISVYGLEKILNKKTISIENFVIRNIYEVFIFNELGILKDKDEDEFIHNDTRGCLFDMNGDKRDIVYNTEKPIICDECRGKISKSKSKDFLDDIQKELFKIDKPLIKKIENFITKYPLFSVSITFISSILINIFSNWLWEIIKDIKSN